MSETKTPKLNLRPQDPSRAMTMLMLWCWCFTAFAAFAANCDLTGTWSGSWERHNFPPSKGDYKIKQTGQKWEVDTTTEHWKHGEGTVTADGSYITVYFPSLQKTLHGKADSTCKKLFWDNKSIWCETKAGDKSCGEAPPAPSHISKVHMVFMNHLDVGFTNTIASVMNIYWHEYWQRAIDTAAALNVVDKPLFKYTSHAYLLDLFFNCPSRLGLHCDLADADDDIDSVSVTPNFHSHCVICPNSTSIAAVKKAIADGVITWHAFPLNAEPELADASLFSAGIDSVHALDDMFGVAHKTVISQRDVPGVSRSVIPLMRRAGVLAFSEGVNGQVEPPQLPPIFNWTDPISGESIVVLLHPRGYGVQSSSNTKRTDTQSADEKANSFEASPLDLWDSEDLGIPHKQNLCPDLSDTVTVEGFDEALVYLFKGDNQGPHNAQEAHTAIGCVKKLFPSAELIGSTYDAFVHNLIASTNGTSALPVVTEEMGDTWIFGMQADSMKTKLLRIMMRARVKCLANTNSDPATATTSLPACDATDPSFRNFSRLLIKSTEHTFGLHGMGESTGYTNANLTAILSDPGSRGQKFRNWTQSWVEQRLYIDYAHEALLVPPASHTQPNSQLHSIPANQWLHQEISEQIAAARPSLPPNLAGYVRVAQADLDSHKALSSTHFNIVVDPATGGLLSLVSKGNLAGREWANPSEPLLQFLYQSNNQKDDMTLFRQNYTQGEGRGTCYDKVGLDDETCSSDMGCAKSQFWQPKLLAAYFSAAPSSGARKLDNLRDGAHGGPFDEYLSANVTGDRVLLHLEMDTEAHTLYGSPSEVWLEIILPEDAPTILCDLQLVNKTATRIPEAIFFTFPVQLDSDARRANVGVGAATTADANGNTHANVGSAGDSAVWQLDKLGQWVDSQQVVDGGAVHLHAVGDQGVRINPTTAAGPAVPAAAGVQLQAIPVDSGLVSIGRKSAFPTPLVPLSAAEAQGPVYFILQDNYWDVNYPFWYPFDKYAAEEKNARFRFVFKFGRQ